MTFPMILALVAAVILFVRAVYGLIRLIDDCRIGADRAPRGRMVDAEPSRPYDWEQK